jgi:hypothetical protein
MGICTISADVFNPGSRKSRVAVTTSELASPVKGDLESAEIDVLIRGCLCGLFKSRNRIYPALVNTVTNRVTPNVFDLPAVFAALGPPTLLHVLTVLFFLGSVVQCPGVGLDILYTYSMCRRMMAAGSHARAQPYGGIIPLGATKTGRNGVKYLLAELEILHGDI